MHTKSQYPLLHWPINEYNVLVFEGHHDHRRQHFCLNFEDLKDCFACLRVELKLRQALTFITCALQCVNRNWSSIPSNHLTSCICTAAELYCCISGYIVDIPALFRLVSVCIEYFQHTLSRSIQSL